MSDIRVKTFTLSRKELQDYLIAMGEPEDIVITNIARPVNQEAWLISVQSKDYPLIQELSVTSTKKNSLLG